MNTKIENLDLRSMLCALVFSVFCFGETFAQEGTSTASLAMGKMRAASLSVPVPEEIIVEDYVNYHKHGINRPGKEGGVAVDVRWGAEAFEAQTEEAILQVGLATGYARNMEDLPPVNLSLVIDKSGSMTGDRIEKAKEAAHELVKRLREGDIISIVAFDNNVEVVFPAAAIRDHREVHDAINRIFVQGGTDLNAGMITGYEQVVQNHKKESSNKVIMLTDALTNQGITNPDQIVRNSEFYSEDYQVEFTIVGVGVDFNAGLARQLTGSARSTIHFVNDPEDIKKVFIDEVESLLAPVARKVHLVIEYSKEMELKEIYGYAPEFEENRIILELENLNSGMSQVVLCRFGLPDGSKAEEFKAEARLVYLSASDLSRKTVKGSARADIKARSQGLTDSDVLKNYTIALMASSYREMAGLYHLGNRAEAQKALRAGIDYANLNFPAREDRDIVRVLDIIESYAKRLEGITARENGRQRRNILLNGLRSSN